LGFELIQDKEMPEAKPMTQDSNSDFHKKELIYIPIIHTPADMGGLSGPLQEITLQKLGKEGWEKKQDLVNQLWSEIERFVDTLPLRYEKVRLYQDGLPVCGRESTIVEELAKMGSRNHQIIFHLMEKGAIIMGTESSELLLEEYGLMKQILAMADSGKSEEVEACHEALSHSLLERRNEYIARRINDTLQEGETGILFLGMLHSIEHLLNKDIRVIYPIHQPFSGKEKHDAGQSSNPHR